MKLQQQTGAATAKNTIEKNSIETVEQVVQPIIVSNIWVTVEFTGRVIVALFIDHLYLVSMFQR